MNKNLFKILQNIIKYAVGVGLFSLTLHVGLLLYGIDEPWTEWLLGISVLGFITLLLASYVLKLCWKFRLALYYIFLVSGCVHFQRAFSLFNGILTESRVIVLIIGIIINLIIIKDEYFIAKTAREACN